MSEKLSQGHDIKIRIIFLIVVSLMVILLIDTSFIKLYDLVNKTLFSIQSKKIIFTLNSSFCLLFQFIILRYTKNIVLQKEVRAQLNLKSVNRLGTMSYYFVIALFSYLFFQIFYFDYYFTSIIMLIIFVTYGVASVFVARTAILFLRWYRQNHKFIILMYFLSMSLITFNLVLTNVLVNINLNDRPPKTGEFLGGTMDISAGKYKFFNSFHKLSSIISFSCIWLTTSILMYSTKDALKRQVRYWIMPIVLIIYFFIGYFAGEIFRPIFIPMIQSDPGLVIVSLTMIFTLTKPIGGLMFGIAFWNISKNVSYDRTLREYLIISGYGFLLLFSANQATSLVLAPFPPFGVATISILIISSFLITVGIYRSASLVSINNTLRNSIHQITKESKLLDLIGKAEMEKEITRIVNKAVKKTESENIEASNIELNEQELKSYVIKVADQLRKSKKED